jgi:O-antigen biosynthesis protein
VAWTQSAKAHAAGMADLSSRLEASQAALSRAVVAHEAALEQSARTHVAGMVELSSRLEASQSALSEAETAHRTKVAEMTARHSDETRRLQEATQQVEESLQARFTEIAKLSTIVFDFERDLAKERALRKAEGLEAISRIAGLERELDLHRRLAADRLERIRRMQDGRLWKAAMALRRLAGLIPATPPMDAPVVSDEEAIRKYGLFDSEWYLRRYADVRKEAMDPLKHYLRYGAAEGRDPGPGFGTRDYLQRYPDVAASGLNPLLHYVRFGIGEGRMARDHGQEEMS